MFLSVVAGGVLTAFLLIVFTGALAGGGFAISWWTVDSGGGLSEGGDFALQSTIGQPDTGTSAGGAYTVNGGFWNAPGPVNTPQDSLYLPAAIR
jgi:hypothetical protein